ncbi:MAG: hypothetical protein K0R28_57 [Paenibacillus sp.]|jgi:hypothetical protein|nr:hypothetical protein [Paenibacillus sp.]
MIESPVNLDIYKILKQIAIDSSKITHFMANICMRELDEMTEKNPTPDGKVIPDPTL